MKLTKRLLRPVRALKRRLASTRGVSHNTPPAPVERIFLHIGSHKTGSTYLQRLLNAHRLVLQEHGLFFPGYDLRYNEFRSTPGATSGHSGICRGINAQEQRKSELRKLNMFAAESECRSILLSSETMFGGKAVTVAQALQEYYPGARLTIIAFLRRQDLFIESIYKERLRWKSYSVKTNIQGYLEMQGEQFFDYRIRLAKVLEYADADLAFMPYDDVKAGGGVKQAFLQAIGLGGLDLEDPVSDTIHDSIDNRLTNLFALINNNIRLDKKQRTLLTRILSSADLGKERSSLLDWDTRLAIRDRYIESNRQLAASHFSMDSPIFNFEKDFVPITETTQYWSIEKTAAYLESFKRAETGED